MSAPEDRAAEVRLANQMFAGRRGQYMLEKRFIHASGARIPCRVHVSMVRDANGAPESVIATVLDRRPEIELEELRARATEVRSIRTMAERLAHDFGNALSVVQLESVLSSEALEAGEDVQTHLQAVREAAGICSRLVSNLRQLSATGVPSTSRIDIGEELRVHQAAFRGLVGGGRQFEIRVPSGPVEVALNRTSLDRILLNVLSNAAHHTPPGGCVSVSVDASTDWVRMQIEDTGVGMPEAVRARALEPFYTARKEGSGLGLAIVNGLVSGVGGSVAIASTEGLGTTVEIKLPRLEPHVQAPEDRDAG
ncbi:MAG: ATP-binding protein [Myxococcota bacterium]|nr:ATP-binding protein [Myxococcota bacterium]